jgi:hypothetical protein
MRVKVTHLKAPWPAWVALGDVLELAGPVPEWAVGKCHVTDDEPTVYAVEKDSGDSAIVANIVPDSIAEAEAQAAYEIAAMHDKGRRKSKG